MKHLFSPRDEELLLQFSDEWLDAIKKFREAQQAEINATLEYEDQREKVLLIAKKMARVIENAAQYRE